MKKFRKVLLVDADPISTYITSSIMGREGFAEEIITTRSGEQAYEMLKGCTSGKAAHDCPDLIFIDPMLPGMDGFELMEEYRKLSPALTPKVVFLSVTGDLRAMNQDQRLEAVDFLVKPLTTQALANLLPN
ncbi:two-component system response regulator [Rufibacter sediminis]|uniref:Response regulator n=1 Tax=Rufibacter sediminis TaxID=2762756 RepID=A0ABR6VP16_9BACT|nr:response regulator [Rufibacter sediminis]MBC3538937.1 response regulator [Rufibacter sediminis]